MTFTHMKAFGPHFSTLLFALPILATAATVRAATLPCVAKAAIAPADQAPDMAYPTFCAIPKTPTEVRAPAAFKAAVLDTRRTGAALVRATSPASFELPASGGGAFGSEARAEAAPPPAMNPQNVTDAVAFARDGRARAAPPKRPH
jgi:hypothetical protein